VPNVLIVENEPVAAGYLKAVIEDVGYSVCGMATTADEAVALSDQKAPDLILMEVKLPGTSDGVDAAVRINEKTHIPVVYLLEPDDASAAARIKSGNPADILVKPFVVHRVWRALVGTCPPEQWPEPGGEMDPL
jgi:two-component system, response regulator PdtaR